MRGPSSSFCALFFLCVTLLFLLTIRRKGEDGGRKGRKKVVQKGEKVE